MSIGGPVGLYAALVGQDRAVAELRAAALIPVHAYLLVGPAGTGAREAAQSFAASLLCPDGGCGRCEVCRRALAGVHPDVVIQERTGPFITVDDARSVGRVASLSPVEGRRKVVVLIDFHLVDKAAPALLKTIEEPPPSTVFVVLAEHVPPELVTIASRCVRIDLMALSPEAVAAALVAEGVDRAVADEVAAAAGGRMDRARLLLSDDGFVARRALWRSVPSRLDGTGATVAALVDELLASIETLLVPVTARHAGERAALEEQVKRYGPRPGAAVQMAARHKREDRRVRTDELRFGLGTLAAAYRDRLVAGTRPAGALAALDAIARVNEAMAHNPNPVLLLQGLLVTASRVAASTPVR
ncbi:MAG: hypothetical protein ACRD1K_12920 [Acidimicrobiales bacterium]